jgi:hypothetical protein
MAEEIFTGMDNGDELAGLLSDLGDLGVAVDESTKAELERMLAKVLETNQGLAMQYCQLQGMFTDMPEEEVHQQLAEAFGLPRAESKEAAIEAFGKSPQMAAMIAGLRKVNTIFDKAFDVLADDRDKLRLKPDSTDKELLGIAVARAIAFVESMPQEPREMMMEMMGPIVEPFKLPQ